jgi:succinate dehydrogenase / fumarate reductase cytochrome b subunit
MAGSGLMLLGFVVLHLLGNLTIFLGPETLNAYAEKLRHFGLLLWVARVILLAAVAVHIWAAVVLTIENRRARPQPYQQYVPAATNPAALTMGLTGILLLSYLVYHLLHFTWGVAHPQFFGAQDALGRRDVYAMVVRSFEIPWVALLYVVGMAVLCFHLSHGMASTCQTLGLSTERTRPLFERIGGMIAGLIFLGYSAIPVAVLFRMVRP